MNQQQLLKVLYKHLTLKGYSPIKTKDYIIAEGEIPICLVAHLDTVGTRPPQDIYYDQEQKVMWSPQLLGADDRAGVYAILDLVESGYRPHIIFTTDEETGCLGSSALVKKFTQRPFQELKAIIQIDRHGSNDCVFYGCDNKDFIKYIESFGFKEAFGTFSDISVLAPSWGVAAVNLSCGYYNEHNPSEFLKIEELEATIEKIKNIFDDVENIAPFVYIEKEVPYLNIFEKSFYELNKRHCIICGQTLEKNQFVAIKNEGFDYEVCNSCYLQYYANDN